MKRFRDLLFNDFGVVLGVQNPQILTNFHQIKSQIHNLYQRLQKANPIISFSTSLMPSAKPIYKSKIFYPLGPNLELPINHPNPLLPEPSLKGLNLNHHTWAIQGNINSGVFGYILCTYSVLSLRWLTPWNMQNSHTLPLQAIKKMQQDNNSICRAFTWWAYSKNLKTQFVCQCSCNNLQHHLTTARTIKPIDSRQPKL